MSSAPIARKTVSKEELQKLGKAAVEQIQTLLPKFKMVLPPHVAPERFARVCITAITQDQKLLACTPKSILEACLTAAQLGLEPNKHIGEGYFIPFWDSKEGINKCQWMTGYKGFQTLARNSGEVSMLDAQVVYSDDTFEYEYGLDAKLRHIPAEGERQDDRISHAWAMVKYKDGAYAFRVLTRAEIDKRRRVSKNSDKGPWKDWLPEMCRKTAIRALSSSLPKSVQKVAAMEAEIERGNYARLDEENDGELLIDILPTEDDSTTATDEAPKTVTSRLDSFATQEAEQAKQPDEPTLTKVIP